jgi:hypothetical protein
VDELMIPRALRFVAVIQLLGGLAAAAGIVVQMMHGHLNLDFGVLGIPIFFGLTNLRCGWRTCALVFIWVGILLAPIAFFLGLAAQSPAYLLVFGIRLADVSPVWLSVVSVPVFLLQVWQYQVLTRPDVRSLFLGVDALTVGSEIRVNPAEVD